MKKTLLSFALLLAAMTAAAQPVPNNVEPGIKGPLPEVQPVSEISEPNRFGGLWLTSTLGSHYWGEYAGAIGLGYKNPSLLGGEYYTLQYRKGGNGEWATQTGTDGTAVKYQDSTYPDQREAYMSFKPEDYATYQLRLLMHGGSRDGYTSNVVEAHLPAIPTAYAGYGMEGIPTYYFVGLQYGGNYNLVVTTWGYDEKGNYGAFNITNDDGYYRFAWYRQNPVTMEMTKIEGADKDTYTPTIADAGYDLYQEISGDGTHCDFVYRYALGRIFVPVRACPAYYGSDGFALNTEYVLPTPGQDLMVATGWDSENYGWYWMTVGHRLTVNKPGQYAVRLSQDEYMYQMVELSQELTDKGYALTFTYDHGEEDSPLWYREVQLRADRYMGPLTVRVTSGGNPVEATVDVLGTDIDGKLVVKASATTDAATGEVTFSENLYTLGDGYYVRARTTESSQDVYYPGATTQAGAQLVIPEYDENWNPKTITIELQGGDSKQGDTNGDGTVDVADIAAVISVMAGSATSVGSAAGNADVNGDGTVDVADIATIISIMAKQ